MGTMADLKPCPFCGSNRLNIYKSHGGAAVKCMDCGVRGVMASIWNQRVPASEVQRAREEALEEAADLAAAERHNRGPAANAYERGAIASSCNIEDAIRALATPPAEPAGGTTMATTPEGKIKAHVKKVLLAASERFGYIYSHWPVPSGFGRQTLDCLGAIKGLAFAIETKAPGKKPTPRQELAISEMREAGMKVFVIDGDTSELEAWLSHVAGSEAAPSP